VQLVVSDTGPINYLVLIGYIDVLPHLFQKIVMPLAVRDELMDQRSKSSFRATTT
jgi:predicted nucleic acid-binding protein